jgi:hypothetical protein
MDMPMIVTNATDSIVIVSDSPGGVPTGPYQVGTVPTRPANQASALVRAGYLVVGKHEVARPIIPEPQPAPVVQTEAVEFPAIVLDDPDLDAVVFN